MAEQRMIMARAKSMLGSAPYRVDVDVGRHHLVVDEHERLGGRDDGPTPYEHLLAGLCACTSITLRMYADRKGWDIGAIGVDLRLTRSGEGERIDRTIRLAGDVSPEQQERLADLAERTPVTLTLKRGLEIRTEVRGAGANA